MSTHQQLLYHIVFSTKNRQRWLTDGFGEDAVVAYIEKQMEHHKKKTFEDEYLAMLAKHEVEYDPKPPRREDARLSSLWFRVDWES